MGRMVIASLDAAVAKAVQKISRLTVPDMPDRTIAALILRRVIVDSSRVGERSIW
jgi:hypothetical protein